MVNSNKIAACCAGLAGLYFLLLSGVQADESSTPAVSGPLTPDIVARLYQKNCAACHGDQGDGKSRAQFGLNPPPRNFTTAESWYELSRERMLTSVRYGRPGTAMVGWDKRLSDDEISALVDYIRGTFMHDPGDDSIFRGKQLYKKNCSACHGDRGNGASWAKNSLNPSPRNFTAPRSLAELTRARMLTSVTHGRAGTAMMPFKSRLSETDIAAVVDYIRTEFMGIGKAGSDQAHAAVPPVPAVQEEPPVVAADMSMAFPHGLAGDPDKGRQFYMQNCFTCHGKQGDGKGPRASFIYPPPRNFLLEKSRQTLNRPELYRAISNGRNGTVMPAWSRVLDDQQIADVAEFVFRTFIQSDAEESHSTREQAADSHKKKGL